MKCPFCGANIKQGGNVCEKCNSIISPKFVGNKKSINEKIKYWVLGIAGFMIFFMLVSFIVGILIPTEEKNQSTFEKKTVVSEKQSRDDFASSLMTIYQSQGSDLSAIATDEGNKTLQCWSNEFNRAFVQMLINDGFADLPKSKGFTRIEFYNGTYLVGTYEIR